MGVSTHNAGTNRRQQAVIDLLLHYERRQQKQKNQRVTMVLFGVFQVMPLIALLLLRYRFDVDIPGLDRHEFYFLPGIFIFSSLFYGLIWWLSRRSQQALEKAYTMAKIAGERLGILAERWHENYTTYKQWAHTVKNIHSTDVPPLSLPYLLEKESLNWLASVYIELHTDIQKQSLTQIQRENIQRHTKDLVENH